MKRIILAIFVLMTLCSGCSREVKMTPSIPTKRFSDEECRKKLNEVIGISGVDYNVIGLDSTFEINEDVSSYDEISACLSINNDSIDSLIKNIKEIGFSNCTEEDYRWVNCNMNLYEPPIEQIYIKKMAVEDDDFLPIKEKTVRIQESICYVDNYAKADEEIEGDYLVFITYEEFTDKFGKDVIVTELDEDGNEIIISE